MRFITKIILPISYFLILSCTLAPSYKKPEIDTPIVKTEEGKKQISKISWQEFFTTPDLQRVIKNALDKNKDLKIANLNIESARAIHNIQRAALLPNLNINTSQTRQNVSGAFSAFTPENIYRANIGLTSYEIDFFGRIQSLKKAALEDYFASIAAKDLMQTILIAEVANSYAQLILDWKILEISQKELDVLKEKNLILKTRFEKGLISKDDFSNAEVEVENKRIEVANYEKIIEQDQNALMILSGEFDNNNLPQIANLDDIKINEDALEFNASETLLSRFDIKQAEANLKKANANIGAARAAFFPSISISGAYGYQSLQSSQLFNSKNWNFTPQINVPIFSGGRATANLKNANVLKEIEIVQYQKTIQNAFREALDKLSERQAIVTQFESAKKIFDNKDSRYKNSISKTKKGLIGKLELSNYQLDFFAAEKNKLAVQKAYLANLIELYKTLGGGSDLEN